MARMLRARSTSWRRVTRTYGYDVKANPRRLEERSWRREWDEDENGEWYARYGLAHLMDLPA